MQLRWSFLSAILMCCTLPVINAAVTGKALKAKTEAEITAHLTVEYETDASEICNELVGADWDYSTDVNNETKEEALVRN
jgi:hypothetical protein